MESANTLSDPIMKADETKLQQFHLKLALDAANMGIWDWNIQAGEVRWTENVEKILGSMNTYDGRAQFYLKSIVDEDREYVTVTINQAIRRRIDFAVEHRVRLQDGSIRWIEGNGNVIYDESGKAQTLTGTVKDITDRKKT
jgi:two-component system, NtrC family, sensor kinase